VSITTARLVVVVPTRLEGNRAPPGIFFRSVTSAIAHCGEPRGSPRQVAPRGGLAIPHRRDR
jgi:hypothetical protein